MTITHVQSVYTQLGKLKRGERQPWLARVHEQFHQGSAEHSPQRVWVAAELVSPKRVPKPLSGFKQPVVICMGYIANKRVALEVRTSADIVAMRGWMLQMIETADTVAVLGHDTIIGLAQHAGGEWNERSLFKSRTTLENLRISPRGRKMEITTTLAVDDEHVDHAWKKEQVSELTERCVQRCVITMLRDREAPLEPEVRRAMVARVHPW